MKEFLQYEVDFLSIWIPRFHFRYQSIKGFTQRSVFIGIRPRQPTVLIQIGSTTPLGQVVSIWFFLRFIFRCGAQKGATGMLQRSGD